MREDVLMAENGWMGRKRSAEEKDVRRRVNL